MLCINTFGRVRYFPDQAKKKIQNGRTSTLNPSHVYLGFYFQNVVSTEKASMCDRLRARGYGDAARTGKVTRYRDIGHSVL